jgi:hypothetical protein
MASGEKLAQGGVLLFPLQSIKCPGDPGVLADRLRKMSYVFGLNDERYWAPYVNIFGSGKRNNLSPSMSKRVLQA